MTIHFQKYQCLPLLLQILLNDNIRNNRCKGDKPLLTDNSEILLLIKSDAKQFEYYTQIDNNYTILSHWRVIEHEILILIKLKLKYR